MILPNHLLPVLSLSIRFNLLRQLMLACFQFSFPLYPFPSRHFVIPDIIYMSK